MTTTLAELLRTYSEREFRSAEFDRVAALPYCPLCHCNKSQDVNQPNGRTDACDDADCDCHSEDL